MQRRVYNSQWSKLLVKSSPHDHSYSLNLGKLKSKRYDPI